LAGQTFLPALWACLGVCPVTDVKFEKGYVMYLEFILNIRDSLEILESFLFRLRRIRLGGAYFLFKESKFN